LNLTYIIQQQLLTTSNERLIYSGERWSRPLAFALWGYFNFVPKSACKLIANDFWNSLKPEREKGLPSVIHEGGLSIQN
jgi:hypothetical protein